MHFKHHHKICSNLKYHAAGDSAYVLLSFMLIPYAIDLNDAAWKYEDNFNYHLSSARIWIECAFGELIMRWGTFWRRLTFGIDMCGDTTIASMLLHNFIIDHRIVDNDTNCFSNFNVSEEDMLQNASF